MLFRNALLRYTPELQLLTSSQLANKDAVALWIQNHRLSPGRHSILQPSISVPVRPRLSVGCSRRAEARLDVEVLGVHFDDLVTASIRGIQAQDDAAVVAELVAVAVACIEEFVNVLCAQGDET